MQLTFSLPKLLCWAAFATVTFVYMHFSKTGDAAQATVITSLGAGLLTLINDR